MDQCFAVAYGIMKFNILQNEGNSLASSETSSFQEGLFSVKTFIYLDTA